MKKTILLLCLLFSSIYGNLEKKEDIIINGTKKIKDGEIILRYNHKGEVVEQITHGKRTLSYSQGELVYSTINYFDEDKNMVKTEVFDRNETLIETIDNKFGAEGLLLSTINSSVEGVLEYSYDEYNRVSSMKHNGYTTKYIYGEDGTLDMMVNDDIATVKYRYDKDHKLIDTEYTWHNTGLSNYSKPIYDSKGLINSYIMYIDNPQDVAGKVIIQYSDEIDN